MDQQAQQELQVQSLLNPLQCQVQLDQQDLQALTPLSQVQRDQADLLDLLVQCLRSLQLFQDRLDLQVQRVELAT